MARRTPGRVGRTRWLGVVAAMLVAWLASSGPGGVRAQTSETPSGATAPPSAKGHMTPAEAALAQAAIAGIGRLFVDPEAKKPSHGQTGYINNFEGSPVDKAVLALRRQFRPSVTYVASNRPKGIVDLQDPKNVEAAIGTPVALRVSNGQPATRFVTDYEGQDAKLAQALLQKDGFHVADWTWTPSNRPRGIVEFQDPKNVDRPIGAAVTFKVSTGSPPLGFVRNYEGQEATFAQQSLTRDGFRVIPWVWAPSRRPRGIVDTQEPKDAQLPFGAPVTLKVSDGTPPMGFVRSFVGQEARLAEAGLTSDGFRVAPWIWVDSKGPRGIVDEQDPKDASRPLGATVAIKVSDGKPPMAQVRDFEGWDAQVAEISLQKAGFQVADWTWAHSSQPKGLVVAQNPKGVGRPIGDLVTLKVSLGPQPTSIWTWIGGVAAVGAAAGGGLGLRKGYNSWRRQRLIASIHAVADRPTAGAASLDGPADRSMTVDLHAELTLRPGSLEPTTKDPP